MKKIITYILALLVGCSMLAVPMTEARADDGVSTASRGGNGGFTDAEVQELEQNLTILFSQVVTRDAEGKLRIDYEAAKRLYPDRDLSVLFEAAKGSASPSDSSEAEGAQEYASCVIKGPFHSSVSLISTGSCSAHGSPSRTGERSPAISAGKSPSGRQRLDLKKSSI